MIGRTLALVAFAWSLAGCCGPGARRPLVFASDFGEIDGAVSAMKGVALGIEPSLSVHDLTHLITPFSIWEGAYRIAASAPSWPRGTVFVCVVDPGVGTDRAPIVLRTREDRIFVGPDNGLFTVIADREGVAEVRVIDVARHQRGSASSHTFHGRDLFAVVGASLAGGRLSFAAVGEPLGRDPVRLPILAPERSLDQDGTPILRGSVTVLDARYGNVWTNLPEALLTALAIGTGDSLAVTIREDDAVRFDGVIPFVSTFGDVAEGAPLAYLNSDLELAFAIHLGSFAEAHAIAAGPRWSVEVEKVGSAPPAAPRRTNGP